jgi:hypothetical protein
MIADVLAAVRRAPGADAATRYTLLISAIPEASTWATTLTGFGMMGYALGRRRSRPSVLTVA